MIKLLPLDYLKDSFDIFNDANSYFLIAQNFYLNNTLFCEEFKEKLPQDDNMVWIFTSGTTAMSLKDYKVIGLHKEAILKSAASVNQFLGVTSTDKWINPLPLYHMGGLSIQARSYLLKNEVLPGVQKKWDPRYFFEQSHNAHFSSLVPAQVFDLVDLGLKAPPALKGIIVGGDKLNEELYLKARQLSWPLLPSYGMSELASQIATAKPSSLKETNYPPLKILPHIQLTNNQILSEALYTYELTDHGSQLKRVHHLELKDRLEVKDGHIWGVSRDDDQIKIMGEKVYLSEIKQKLNWIKESFFLSTMKDQRRGQQIILIIETNQKYDLSKINKVLSSLEKISKVYTIKKFPRTALGKIKKNQILNELTF